MKLAVLVLEDEPDVREALERDLEPLSATVRVEPAQDVPDAREVLNDIARDGDVLAVVLAAAGLGRLGRLDVVTEYFELDAWPTAPAQGALAIEVRTATFDDPDGHSDILAALEAIEHQETRAAATAVATPAPRTSPVMPPSRLVHRHRSTPATA